MPPSTPSQSAPIRPIIDQSLTIVSPADHAKIIIDPEANSDRQRVPLRAQLSGALTKIDPLFWFIDGAPLGTANPDQPLWWQPTQGQHEIRVTTPTGHSARATIRVQ